LGEAGIEANHNYLKLPEKTIYFSFGAAVELGYSIVKT